MKLIAILSRMKVSQTITMGCICASMWTTDIFSDVSPETMTIVTVGATLATLVLFSIAHFSKRLIGIVWLDKTRQNVKIAHLTFKGSRRDVVYPVSSLSESGDFKEDQRNIFLKLQVRGTKDYYYYALQGAVLHKPHDFIHVFGMPSYRLFKIRNKDRL